MRPVNLLPPELRQGARTPMRTGPVPYILVGALVGSVMWWRRACRTIASLAIPPPSLIGACVLIAAIAMLFTTRYPPGLF